MNANPNVKMQVVDPPADYASGDFGGFSLACANTAVPSQLGPDYDITAGVQASIEQCLTGVNQVYLINAGSTAPIWTLKGYKSQADLVQGNVTIPAGSLFTLEKQDGPPATTPDAPVVVIKAVFGMVRPTYTYSDGVARRSWTAFNGTTFKAGQVFEATPDNTQTQPGVTPPTYGVAYEIINGYMAPGGVIVEIGDTAVLPVNG